ncbi:MAG: 2Fe-2S iron-sulfur cluster-binding protein [Alsobacter sp.]
MTRLPPPFGSRIDRSRPVRFTFEGRAYEGFEGDCIASALAGAGQWLLSRSFKYHRPRGLMSLAGAEANALVQLPSEPNVAADLAPVSDGMVVTAQNVNGSLDKDRDAVLDRLGRFLPVGFYYRTFMGPSRDSWLKLWEPLIRRKAGLGVVDLSARSVEADQVNLHCDVLVVGAGAAGLAAAVAAAEGGADVVLCDESPELGGWLTYGRGGADRLADLAGRARAARGLRILTGATCNGWFEDNWLPLVQGQTLFRARARQVVLATGAIEQPAIFRNNDLPGIMTAGAAQRLLRHYGVRPARRAVVLSAQAEGLEVALDLLDAGVEVAAVVAPTPEGATGPLAETLAGRGVPILRDTAVAQAAGTSGNRHLAQVDVGGRWIACDGLVVAAGLMPSWQLPCQAGARLVADEEAGRVGLSLAEGSVHLAGAVAGAWGVEAAVEDGRRAGQAALQRLGLADAAETAVSPSAGLPFWRQPVLPHPDGRDFVDFDEDLQVKDLWNAVREGYREIELVKRFTTVGMGPSQGRHSALAAARVVAAATGRSVGEVGITTARPPTGPEPLGLLAGHHEPPERRTALHARHLALGARMKPVGAWWRPSFYGTDSEAARRVAEETAAVRNGVGLLDVSTLGKLEVRGRDAGLFLDRLYTMAHAGQPVGRVRYCLMLNEMGTVIDDGVAYRLAEDRFYVTSTTGAVARVQADMLFWNAQWRLEVDVLNLTAAFSGLNVTGPAARDLLQRLEGTIDFSREAFPYLAGREGRLAGAPVRAMRIGFTGELSYELHCPASAAPALWDAVMTAGGDFGLRPYGLEASRILRLEKGHILIGQDTDALTTPEELGMGWAVSRKKPFFVGKRSIEARMRLGLKRRLAGLTFAPGTAGAVGESCLVMRNGAPVGHVTSFVHSPTLGSPIALAFIHPDDAREGSPVLVKDRGGALVEGRVAGHAFFDPANARQEM